MPNLNSWRQHFQGVVNAVVDSFPKGLPDGVDFPRLREIEDRVQALWSSDSSTRQEWQDACGEYRMFWWRIKNEKTV